jgi:hypothetical protein
MNNKKIKILSVLLLMCVSFSGCAVKKTSFGSTKISVSNKIIRANQLSKLYDESKYNEIEEKLIGDMSGRKDEYGRVHILNELSELYSRHLFDIEKSVEIDREILLYAGKNIKESVYSIREMTANNVFLSNVNYVNLYINNSMSSIVKGAADRLKRNEKLLSGKPLVSSKKYALSALLEHKKTVLSDFKEAKYSKDIKYMLASRLIKVELELYRMTQQTKYIELGYKLLLKEPNLIDNLNFNEIDFISLSDYLDVAYMNSGKIALLVDALDVIYKPYLKLRSEKNRWSYNALVNKLINKLILANYDLGNYSDLAYYVSLNKSRMISEDRLTRMKDKSSNIYSLNRLLPNKVDFISKLADMQNYLDFYLLGEFEREKISLGELKVAVAGGSDWSQVRGIRRKKTGVEADIFKPHQMFVTYIVKGKITTIKLDSDKLSRAKGYWDNMLISSIEGSDNGSKVTQAKYEMHSLIQKIDLMKDGLVVSPDKYLSRYPLDILLDVPHVRTLNAFTYLNKPAVASNLTLLGFFDPLNDLPEAKEEIPYVIKAIPDSKIYNGYGAIKQILRNDTGSKILHLSMHGIDNYSKPDHSKLLFSGSKADQSEDDPYALYAHEMLEYKELKNKDLIFTAACQTGLTREQKGNQSELLGILRPLLLNNNQHILLTLWSVNSESAKYFVQLYYNNLEVKRDYEEAFFEAKKQLRIRYPDPYHWAPYYMLSQSKL